MARHRVEEIAAALGVRWEGNGAIELARAAAPADATEDALAVAMEPAYSEALGQGAARAAILWDGADWRALGLEAAIFVTRPRYAMARLTDRFAPPPDLSAGIHPSAVIDPSARIGDDVAIAPFVVVGEGAVIGDGARIMAHASIAAGAEIGAGALLHPGVRIGPRVRIGARFIAQPNAVIGADGFSFVTPEPGAIEQVRATLGAEVTQRQSSYARIHSLGRVVIGDDVEIGAGSCIDQATLAETVIGDGTKIDNLVQIGHNVQIGRDCLICGQSGIAGSTRLGDRVVLGGQAGVSDHVEIGDDVIAGGGTRLRTSQPAGRVMLGDPAMPMQQSIEAYKALRRLPRFMRQMAEFKKTVSKTGDTD